MAIFQNQATLSYNGNIINSNITTGEITEVLSATKTAVMNDYTQNDDITYVISIINSGDVPFTDISITDNLGAYSFGTQTLVPLMYTEDSLRYYTDGDLKASPAVSATDTELVISGITVPANGNAIIIYETTANRFAPPTADGMIVNEAVITSTGLATPLTVSGTVTAENTAVLSISKTVTPTVITENGQLTYTFIIQNSGNTAASADSNIVVTDTFVPVLNNLKVTYNNTTWTQDVNYTYIQATGVFETIAGQITVPPAVFTQDKTTGEYVVTPGVATLTVTGNI